MMDLERFEFSCPFCGKEKVTFITSEKLDEIRRREKLIQEIFPPQFFDATYREIFVSKICSKCQIDIFGGNENDKPFDASANEKTNDLESRISTMYDDARE
jgi:hypothetical protein